MARSKIPVRSIYAAAATILVEANYQLPMALLAEWDRILRDA
ncbi:hypothetical protein [Methylobacterium sp. J-030]|nr:hypothetical protein [Methylobacterium sp. J-030]